MNTARIFQIQKYLRTCANKKGLSEYADDICQEYALSVLEGFTKHERPKFFNSSYISKYTSIEHEDGYGAGINSHDGASMLENHLDYQTLISKILLLKSSKARRVLILYFIFGLNGPEIAKRENISTGGAFKIIYRSLNCIRRSLDIKP